MISGKTIAKNVGVMMASQLVTWVLAFVLAIYLPRYLGAESVGAISIANSIWMIMGVLITFGMDTHLTKVVASRPEKTSEILGTSLAIRAAFFVAACVVVALYLWGLNYSTETMYVTAITGAAFFLMGITATISAVLSGLERMEFISLSNIVSKAVITGVTILLIFLDAGLYPIVSVNIIGAIVAIAIQGYSLSRQHKLRLRFRWSEARAMLGSSAPYLITALAIVVYQQMDKLFISSMVDTRTVGWYGTAMNLFGTLMFIPVVFGNVIFPALSRSYSAATHHVNLIAQRSFDLMFLFSVPLGLGMVVISKPLIALLYGPEFAPSAGVLAMLGIVLIFTYLNTILGQLLIATERTKPWNMVMIVAILLTIPLDLVLVPWTHAVYGNGGLGGTTAFLVTEFGMVAAAIILLPKGTLQWSNVRTATLALLCGLVMMAACWWLREQNLILSVLAGAIIYSAGILLLRVVPREDLMLIKDGVMNIIGRLRRGKGTPASIGN